MIRTTFLSILLVTVALPATSVASHGQDHFDTDGHILVGNPPSQYVGGASELGWFATGDHALDGIDGQVVEPPAWAPGHPVWVNGSLAAPYDLDVNFYDGARSYISGGDELDDQTCTTPRADEACVVPAEAAYTVVDLWSGADTAFSLEVHAVPNDGGRDGDGTLPYAIPTWFTLADLTLGIKILPPATGPVYDQQLRPFPEGLGLATDSPYVDASLEAIHAFEEAIDAYVAANPSASHLDHIEFDVGVVGHDATVQAFVDADIRVMYGPTAAQVLGVAIATETDGERFEHCDIVDVQWLVYSYSVNDVYNIHGQEFGHCLGLNHPTDESEFPDPALDIMNGIYPYVVGDPETPRLCVSNLDLRVLDISYHWRPNGTQWESPPDLVKLSQDDDVRYPPVGTEVACPTSA